MYRWILQTVTCGANGAAQVRGHCFDPHRKGGFELGRRVRNHFGGLWAALEAAQRDYCEYRAENDPARGMLTRLYGGDRAERLIRNFLFHTDDRLAGLGDL